MMSAEESDSDLNSSFPCVEDGNHDILAYCNGEELPRDHHHDNNNNMMKMGDSSSPSKNNFNSSSGKNFLTNLSNAVLGGTPTTTTSTSEDQQEATTTTPIKRGLFGSVASFTTGGGGVLSSTSSPATKSTSSIRSPLSVLSSIGGGMAETTPKTSPASSPTRRTSSIDSDTKIEGLQNMVSSLRERLEDSEAKLTMYKHLGCDKTPGELGDIEAELIISNLDRASLKEQVQTLQTQLRERDQELTILRLDSLDGSGSRHNSRNHNNYYEPTQGTVEYRRLKSEKDTAMMQAGDLAHKLADTKAEVDELRDRLEATNQQLMTTRTQLEEAEKLLNDRQIEIDTYKQYIVADEASRQGLPGSRNTPVRRMSILDLLKTEELSTSSSSSDSSDNSDDDHADNIGDDIFSTTLVHFQQQIKRLDEEKAVYEAAVQETKCQLSASVSSSRSNKKGKKLKSKSRRKGQSGRGHSRHRRHRRSVDSNTTPSTTVNNSPNNNRERSKSANDVPPPNTTTASASSPTAAAAAAAATAASGDSGKSSSSPAITGSPQANNNMSGARAVVAAKKKQIDNLLGEIKRV